jgi:hypothetical protein
VTEALSSGCKAADWLQQAGSTDASNPPAWIADAANRFNTYCTQRARIYGQETRWPAAPLWQRRRLDQTNDRHLH